MKILTKSKAVEPLLSFELILMPKVAAFSMIIFTKPDLPSKQA
jgi:hypothetical protein